MNKYLLIITMWLCTVLGANAAEHTLRLKAVPAFACSFNFTEQTVEAGENVRIEIKVNNTDSRINLTIKDQDDSEVQLSNYTSRDQLHTGDFLMPDADVTLTVYLNYTPSGLPGDPGILQYNAATKTLTLTSPTPRTLSSNIANALTAKGISRSDVEHLRVIGKIEPYDIGNDNYELRYMTKLKTLDLSGATLVPGDYGRTNVYGLFSYDSSVKYDLEDILLPQGVSEYSNVFHYCSKIKTVTISDLVPPTLQNNVYEYSFSEMSEDAVLYVPAEALGAYLGFTGWSYKFSNIRVKDMNVLKLTLPYDAADGRYNGRRMRFHDKDNGTDMYRPITDKLSYTISCPEGSHWDAYIVNGSDQKLSTISDITITGEETAVTFPPTVDPPADLKFDSRDYVKEWGVKLTKQVTFTAEIGDVITFDTHYYSPESYYPRCKIYLGNTSGPTVYNKYERSNEVIDETVQYLATEDGFVNFYIEYDWNYMSPDHISYFVVDNFKIQHQWGAPSEYKQKIIDAVAEVEDVCDPAVLAEARDMIENMPTTDAEILSMKADIKDLYARLRQYIVVDLGEQPGTLAARLEAAQVKLDEIKEFKLKGKINNADLLTLQNITNSNTIDLTEAYCVEFYLNNEVRITNRKITEFAVPEGLQVVNYIGLYDAVGLKHLIIPTTATYLSISASPYASMQRTTIKAALPPRMNPYSSLRGSIYVPKKSIELYRDQYGNSYNYYAIDEEDDSWPVELNAGLPRTITSEDIAADGIQHNMLVPLNYDRSISQTPGAITIDGTAPVNFGEFTFWQTNYSLPSFTARMNTTRSDVSTPAFISNAPLTADRVSLLWRGSYRSQSSGELTFYTPPMDINVEDMVPTSPRDFIAVYTYSGEKRASGLASSWEQVPFDGIMHSGQGYAIYYAYNEITANYSPIRLTSTGENRNDVFRSDNISVPLAAYPSTETWNAHWNFVGNPYPACFDVTYLDTDNPIVVFAPGGYYGNYMYFTVSPADGDHYVLGPGEAFFIQTDGEATELTFNKEGRQLNHKKREEPSSARASSSSRSIFNLQLLNAEGTELDRTRVVVNPNAKADYERGRDVAKFTNDNPDDEVLYTTIRGTRLSLNERPLADGRFPLGADLKAGKTYTLRLESTVNAGNMKAFVEDTATGTLTPISDTEGYTFTADSQSASRLVLCIDADGITGIQNVTGTGTANESLYDLTGRRVSGTNNKGIYIINNVKIIK